jgi:pimeloyl-ACP methyl ester carboxylesterase
VSGERVIEVRRAGGEPLRVVLRGAQRPRRLALILPGARYTPAHPLLYHTSAALLAQGFSVAAAWWKESPGQAGMGGVEALRARLGHDVEEIIFTAGRDAEELLLVGKSLGTVAMAEVAARGAHPDARGIWLTPLLGEPSVADAIGRAGPRALVVLGSADPARAETALELARSAGARVVEIAGADHGLELADPIASIEALREAVEAVVEFTARARA